MKPKPEEKKQAIILRSKGYSLREIKNALAVSHSSASVWVRNVRLNKEAKLRLECISLRYYDSSIAHELTMIYNMFSDKV